MTAVAAIAAWLGGSMVVLSDGRRGLALGVALAAAGFAALALMGGHGPEAGALLVGGAAASALCLRGRPAGWGVMPSGSTPRLILSIAAGLVSLWLATVVAAGPDPGLRFAVPVALALPATRLLLGAHPAASTAAASVTALALAAGTLLGEDTATLAACVAAAIVAAGVQAIPRREADGA